MDELHQLRVKVAGLERENTLLKEVEAKLCAANQQLLASELQLMRKQEALIRTQKIASVGSWEWEVANDIVTWSDELFHIFRLKPENGAVPYADHPKIYTHESMRRLNAAVVHTLETGTPYEIDLEIIRGDGTSAFCNAHGYAEKDDKGQVTRLYGSFQDITERKKAEEQLKALNQQLQASEQQLSATNQQLQANEQQLRATNQQLRASDQQLREANKIILAAKQQAEKDKERYLGLINNLDSGIAIHAADTSIIRINKRAVELLGLSEDQLLGKEAVDPYWQFIYEDKSPIPFADYPVMQIVNTKKPIKNRVLGVLRKTDDLVWLMVNGIPIVNDNNEIVEIIISFIDITEQKQSEAELKKIEWLLQPKKSENKVKIPDYGDLTILNKERTILEAVGKEVLNGIVLDYLSLLETSAAVYEKNGDYAVGIFSSEWCRFLDCSSRNLCESNDNKKALESGKWLCHESCWKDASEQSIKTKNVVDIECYGGLQIYALPITANNKVIGAINFGYGNPPNNENKLKEIADRYNVSIETLRKLSQNYETRPAFIIDIAKERLRTSARLIGNIVERKEMEVALIKSKQMAEESEANVTAIIEGNNNSIWAFNKNYEILYINHVMQREFHQSFGILLKPGLSLIDALPKALRPFWKPRYDRVLANEQFTLEDAVATNNGIVYIEVTFNPIVKNGQVIGGSCFGSNITSRKLAEMELIEAKEKAEKNEAQLNAILENSPTGFAINKISTGVVTYVNNAFAQAYHIPIEKCSRVSTFFEHVYGDQKELGNKIWSDVTSEDPARMKWNLVPIIDKQTKATHYVSASNIILRKLDLMISTVMDITSQVENERDLKFAVEKAEESDRLKSAFLANMSHEIRTPMNGILGFTDLLKEPKLTGDEKDHYIGIIERSGNRLLNTVNDLIDFSKIEAGQMKIKVSNVSINELVEQLFTFFKVEAQKKGLQLFLDTACLIENFHVNSDKEKIYSILTNIIKNAIKYTQNGKIEFGCELINNNLQFYVKDTGQGISTDRLEVIFHRFIRGGSDNEAFTEGSGLGLSISKAYVEMLGGKIWVESEVGVGSIFYFTIPYNENEELSNKHKGIITEEISKSQIEKLKILIVEDDEVAHSLLSIFIKDISNEVLHAQNGVRAVELCRNNPDIDLILMDIYMPEMNGYDATMKIRAFNKKVVIISQTAYALAGDREKSLEAGCNAYISKPIIKNELMALIRQHVKK